MRPGTTIRHRGFTLVEVAISVAIIAVLTALAAVIIGNYAQPTADKVVVYRDEASEIWGEVDSFRIPCPDGGDPEGSEVSCIPQSALDSAPVG